MDDHNDSATLIAAAHRRNSAWPKFGPVRAMVSMNQVDPDIDGY